MWRTVRILSGQAGLYMLGTALLALSSLVAIPAMLASSGAHLWGQIALGQGLGSMAAVVVGWAWMVDGPVRVKSLDTRNARAEFRTSVIARLSVFAWVVPFLALVSLTFWPGDRAALLAGVFNSVATGLSASWFFIGRRQPLALLLCETLPRVALTMSAVVLMQRGSDAILGITVSTMGILAASIISYSFILWPGRSDPKSKMEPIRSILWARRHGMTTALLSMLYIVMPLGVVGIVARAAQPEFAFADKVIRQFGVGLSPLVAIAQSWGPVVATTAARLRLLMASLCLLSVCVWFALVWILPTVVALLGAGVLVLSDPQTVLVAFVVSAALLDAVLVKSLAPVVGAVRAASMVLTAGLTVGLISVALGAIWFGATGALIGMSVGLLARILLLARQILLHASRSFFAL